MAIDSRAKRASVLGVARPWMRDKDPDATLSALWRASSGWSYGGNAFAAAQVIPVEGLVFSDDAFQGGVFSGDAFQGGVFSGDAFNES